MLIAVMSVKKTIELFFDKSSAFRIMRSVELLFFIAKYQSGNGVSYSLHTFSNSSKVLAPRLRNCLISLRLYLDSLDK